MTNAIDTFREHFNDAVEEVQPSCVFVRGAEFQKAGIEKLELLLKECVGEKNTAITNQANEEANAFLSFECMTRALICELKFYLALKEDKVDLAWDCLVDAEGYAANAMKAHDVAAHLERYTKRLHALEKLLFPQPVFFSTGWVVKSSTCNICGSEYGECDHIKGRPYMGILCHRVIGDAEVREVSVVTDPADKHCRALHFSEGDNWRSTFTHRIVPKEEVKPFEPQKPAS